MSYGGLALCLCCLCLLLSSFLLNFIKWSAHVIKCSCILLLSFSAAACSIPSKRIVSLLLWYCTVIHPVVKCMLFLEHLFYEMVAKKSKDPFGNVRVARKALSKVWCVPLQAHSLQVCRACVLYSEVQRGVPPLYRRHSAERLLSGQQAARLLLA